MRVFRILAVFALALLVCSGAFAGNAQLLSENAEGWQVQYDGDNPVFIWSDVCWDNGEMEIALEFYGDTGGDSWFKLQGEKDTDPTITQTVINSSQTTWLDWHVDILHGTIDKGTYAPIVKKVGSATNWDIAYTHNDGFTDGFGAAWTGGDTSIAPGESLYIKFVWVPNMQGTPSIRQYPTDTGNFIPEPSSMMALAGGLSSMGLAFIRRRK